MNRAEKEVARKWRKNYVRTADCCDICGALPHLIHEIARGIHRQNALMAPYAFLVLCSHCHMNEVHGREEWPVPRQLAALFKSRPDDYDLLAFNGLIGNLMVTQSAVEEYL